MKNNVNQNNAAQSNATTITLRELKAMLPSTKGKRLPGYLQLRQTGEPVVSSKAHGCCMEVYENGFAVYQNESHSTVLRMEHVGLAEFYSEAKDKFSRIPVDDAEWSVAVMINGEDRIEKMYQANVGPNMVSTSDAVEDEDGETCDMEFDAGVDVEAGVIGNNTVSDMFACLTDKQKEAVRLCFIEGRTQREVMEILGLSKGALQERLESAKNKLKNFL